MTDLIQYNLRYNEQITFEIMGTPDAIMDAFGTSSRGAASPILGSTYTDKGWIPINPVDEFQDDLLALQDLLPTSRGGETAGEGEDKGYLLDQGLNPYLDELPEHLQGNLVYPISGVLDRGAFLPAAAAEQLRQAAAVEDMETVSAIIGHYFGPDLELSASSDIGQFASSERGAAQNPRNVYGFMVVNIYRVGLDCERIELNNAVDQPANFFHYYTFPKAADEMKVTVDIQSGQANVAIDDVGGNRIHGHPDPVFAVSQWKKTIRPNQVTRKVGIYLRNTSDVQSCRYNLSGECYEQNGVLGVIP